MKQFLFAFLLTIAPARAASLRLELLSDWRSAPVDPQPAIGWQFNLLFDHWFDQGRSPLGMWGFAMFVPDSQWAEGYVGFALRPHEYLDFGFAIGAEIDPSPFRFGAYAAFETRWVKLLGLAEYGGSGWWWHAEANLTPVSWLEVGAMARAGMGVGGEIKFPLMFGSIMVAPWCAVLAEFDSWRPMGLAGIRFWPFR